MCGQSGVAGSIYGPEKRVAENLMHLNVIRGPHSTGLCAIPRERKRDKPILIKALGGPLGDGEGGSGIMGLKSYTKAMNIHQTVALISHNRWATKGEISAKNAHPFWFDSEGKGIVGTHNGTLYPQSQKKLDGSESHETDSEAVFNTIFNKGAFETIPMLEGAYALVWFDLQKNTLNFIRNEQRPFHFIFSKSRDCIFWSSDAYALRLALENAKIDTGENKLYQLTPDMWMEWAIPDSGKPFPEAKRTPLKGFVYQRQSFFPHDKDRKDSGYRGYPGYGNNWEDFQDGDFSDYSPASNDKDTNTGPVLCKVESKKGIISHDRKSYYDVSEGVWKPIGGVQNSLPALISDKSKAPEAESKTGIIDGKINHTTYSVEKDKQVEQNVLELYAEGASSLSAGRQRLKENFKKARDEKFREQFGQFLDEGMKLRFEDYAQKIFWNYKKCEWVTFGFETIPSKWRLLVVSHLPPNCIPFTKLNVESGGCHLFSYQKAKGKGKKRQARLVFYKGWRGNLLPEMKFMELMAEGCISCQRTPSWGNEVRFIDEKTFLCELCMSSPQVLKYFEPQAKRA